MRVARLGGRYLAGREQRLWVGLACAIGAAGLALGFTFQALSATPMLLWPSIALEVMVGLAAGSAISHRLASVRKGRLGERLVTNLLRSLPDDYWLVNDFPIPGRGNVDHMLLGPCGVVVIETKRWAGRIRCDGDAWSVNGYRRRSASRQVNAGACAVRYLLAERFPDLADSALRWVESVVVFTHPLCRLEVHWPKTTVVRYSELQGLVLELGNRHRIRPETTARLAQALARDLGTDERR